MGIHKCGICNDEWLTEAEYLAHTCKTGFNPTQPEHLGEDFVAVQKAALERGLETIRQEGAEPQQIADQEAAIQQLS